MTRQKSFRAECEHLSQRDDSGLCLITVGNSLRGDDGVAEALCNRLSAKVLENVCRFDLGTHTNYLRDCLTGHRAAFIIDSICDDEKSPGAVTVIDLNELLRNQKVKIKSSHGLSIIDELQLAKKQGPLPKDITFFGIVVDKANWGETLSPHIVEKLPSLVFQLTMLLESFLGSAAGNA